MPINLISITATIKLQSIESKQNVIESMMSPYSVSIHKGSNDLRITSQFTTLHANTIKFFEILFSVLVRLFFFLFYYYNFTYYVYLINFRLNILILFFYVFSYTFVTWFLTSRLWLFLLIPESSKRILFPTPYNWLHKSIGFVKTSTISQ